MNTVTKILRLKPIKTTADLDLAIIAAKKIMEPVQKAQTGNRNRMYANIDDVLAAIEMPLLDNNLTVFHERLVKNGKEYFKTTIKHAPTGQKRSECRPYIPDSNASMTVLHAQAAAETFMRRYALNNLLSLRAGDLDKDGDDINNQADKPTSQTTQKTDVQKISNERLAEIQDLIASASNGSKLLYAIKKHNDIEVIQDLTVDKVQRVIDYIHKWRE